MSSCELFKFPSPRSIAFCSVGLYLHSSQTFRILLPLAQCPHSSRHSCTPWDSATVLDSTFGACTHSRQTSPLSLNMTSVSPDPPTWRVSTTFYPGAQLTSSTLNEPPDIVLSTIPEGVHFYVHSTRLLRRSINAFAFLITPQSSVSSMTSDPSPFSLYQQSTYTAPSRSQSRSTSTGSGESSRSNSMAQQMPHVVIPVHENADVLNLLLHAVYDISPERYAPSLDTLSRLPGALLNYGYSLEEHIAPGSELTRLFLAYAREQPLEVYALAASYHLEHLAQRASKPSLSTHLSTMTEQQVRYPLHVGKTAYLTPFPLCR